MLESYQEQIDDQFKKEGWKYWPPLSQLARLTEETGEVARVMNDLFGPKAKKEDEEKQDLSEELADVIFACICIANSQDINLDPAMQKAIAKGPSRNKNRKK